MSGIVEEKSIPMKKAVIILLAVVVIVSGLGYYIGLRFFWDRYDTSSVYERQLNALENFADKNPKNRNAKVMLFDKYFGLGEYGKAEKVLAELKKDLSKNPDIVYRDALLMRQNGDKDKALLEIKKVVDQKPFFTPARILYAQLLADNKKYDQAISEMTMVLKIMPAAADLNVELAKFYLAKGDKKNALDAVNKALKMVPSYKEALELKDQIK